MRQKVNEVRGWDAAMADLLGTGDPTPPSDAAAFLDGMSVLDIGCGGGILTESVARLGARVTGVDASKENIRIASLHTSGEPGGFAHPPTYRHATAETLRDEGQQFDVVTAMEVVEHVNDPAAFLRCLSELVRPGGHLFLSTMSRTALSYLLTIFLAEDVLRVVSPGTHRHDQYINPDEMAQFFRTLGWIRDDDAMLAQRTKLPSGAPPAPIPPRLQFESRGTMYLPPLRRWILMPPSVADAQARGERGPWMGGQRWSELCNYFFWVRRPEGA
ncbi:hypothetical protein MSPP1_004188 [Malassezia sp. CBS 17886]|nr:hypothetical protein MSPP1_004188 [Malassezia sp. CBS 17886]